MAEKLQNVLKTGIEKGRTYYWKLSNGNEVMLSGGGNSGYWQVWVRDKVGGSTAVSPAYVYLENTVKELTGYHTIVKEANEQEAYETAKMFAENLIKKGLV